MKKKKVVNSKSMSASLIDKLKCPVFYAKCHHQLADKFSHRFLVVFFETTKMIRKKNRFEVTNHQFAYKCSSRGQTHLL